MKKRLLVMVGMAALAAGCGEDAQSVPGDTGSKGSQEGAAPVVADNNSGPVVTGVPDGTVITPAFAAVVAQDAYVWGWPIVNAFHRRASFASAPEPGLQGGVLPVAPTGYVSMLTDYIDPSQRWVAHPNQDVTLCLSGGRICYPFVTAGGQPACDLRP